MHTGLIWLRTEGPLTAPGGRRERLISEHLGGVRKSVWRNRLSGFLVMSSISRPRAPSWPCSFDETRTLFCTIFLIHPRWHSVFSCVMCVRFALILPRWHSCCWRYLQRWHSLCWRDGPRLCTVYRRALFTFLYCVVGLNNNSLKFRKAGD